MAKTTLSEDSTIKVNLSNESNLSVNMSVDNTNYIPGYKEAEEQRRKNEEQRIANEIERENYFEDMQEKVESGYFNGEPGPRGPAGPPGEPGYTPIKGVDYFDGQDGKDGQDAPKYTAGTNIEITEDNVINCTATGGGGTLTEELDPTVPAHVKNITEADIEKWNSGTGGSNFSGDYNDLTNKPTNVSQFKNDCQYVQHVYLDALLSEEYLSKDEFNTVMDETMPVIGEELARVEGAIPTNTSQLTNDSGFVTEDTNTTYTLSKDGSTVKLTGSDGSSSEVTVTEGGGSAEYDVATSTTDGLMSASDKSKLDGISAGANKTTVDSALSSSSTNPIQNKVVNSALSGKQSKVLSGTGVPASSLGSNGDVYFQTVYDESNDVFRVQETVVGEWIDGKPIYRKVVDLGGLPNKTTKQVAHGISNLDFMITIKGCAKNSSGPYYIPLPTSNATSANYQLEIFCYSDYIQVTAGDNKSGYTEAYAILEYTKTTD